LKIKFDLTVKIVLNEIDI